MKGLIINPGSHVEGGTFEQAQENAARWLRGMERNGITGLEVSVASIEPDCSRWRFTFRHKVTGVEQFLDVHGLNDDECRALMFWPRTYWNGSSSSTPELADFLAPGFHIAIVPDEPVSVPIGGSVGPR